MAEPSYTLVDLQEKMKDIVLGIWFAREGLETWKKAHDEAESEELAVTAADKFNWFSQWMQWHGVEARYVLQSTPDIGRWVRLDGKWVEICPGLTLETFEGILQEFVTRYGQPIHHATIDYLRSMSLGCPRYRLKSRDEKHDVTQHSDDLSSGATSSTTQAHVATTTKHRSERVFPSVSEEEEASICSLSARLLLYVLPAGTATYVQM